MSHLHRLALTLLSILTILFFPPNIYPSKKTILYIIMEDISLLFIEVSSCQVSLLLLHSPNIQAIMIGFYSYYLQRQFLACVILSSSEACDIVRKNISLAICDLLWKVKYSVLGESTKIQNPDESSPLRTLESQLPNLLSFSDAFHLVKVCSKQLP